jgi:hypothetical protein
MKNIKTTLTGVFMIVAAVSAAILTYLKTGQLPDLTILFATISGGVGLIFAKDATTKDK